MADGQITISKELFNPAFFVLQHHMEDPNIRYIYLYGGSSAAKTYSLCQRIVIDVMTKGYNVLVTRKFSSDMEDSIYADIKNIILAEPKDGGLDQGHQFEILTKKITCKKNGAFIRFRGMDEPHKIQGISQFRYVVLEEFYQYDEIDNKVARKRLRGAPNQKLIYTWNPIDELSWQKQKLIDKEKWVEYNPVFFDENGKSRTIDDMTGVKDSMIAQHQINVKGNAVLLRTNYLDNWYIVGHPNYRDLGLDKDNGGYGYVDQHVIDDMEQDKVTDWDTYYVYGLGHWGRVNRGGEFYKTFDEKRTVFKYNFQDFDELLPFHISVDENVNPYLSLTVWQASGKKAWTIAEFAMENPKNTLRDLANAFASQFIAYTKSLVYIYGDSTSIKEDTKLEKGENFYKIFRTLLEGHGFRTRMRVPRKNPGQIVRGQFLNQIFSEFSYKDIDLKIGAHCEKTIQDIKYLKEAQDGRKFKEKVTDTVTKVRYEKFGHLSDTMDYFVCEYFKEEFRDFQTGKWRREPKIIERLSKSLKANHY